MGSRFVNQGTKTFIRLKRSGEEVEMEAAKHLTCFADFILLAACIRKFFRPHHLCTAAVK